MVAFPMISRLAIFGPILLTLGLGLGLLPTVVWATDAALKKPAGQVLDQAGVLLPETAAALDQELIVGARTTGVSIYVLTVPTVGGTEAEKPRRLSFLAHRYAERWLLEGLGAVILFDDGSGSVIVVANQATDRRFPPWSRNLAMVEPLGKIEHSPSLAREKLVQTARLLLTTLSGMQEEERAVTRQRRRVSVILGCFALAGLALIAHSFWKKDRPEPRAPDAP